MLAPRNSMPIIGLAIVFLGITILDVRGDEVTEQTAVSPEEFKYVVGIFRNNLKDYITFICTGVIISEYHVLTTGSCVFDTSAKKTFIASGVRNVNDDTVPMRTAKKIIVHPEMQFYGGFPFTMVKNNIGLILLQRSMKPELTTGSLAQLPLSHQLKPTEPCMVVSAGQKKPSPDGPRILHKIEQSLVDFDKCLILSTSSSKFFPVSVIDIMGTDDKSLCGQPCDDSICLQSPGGPLVCNGSLAGLMSRNNCHLRNGNRFANIYLYREWILNETSPHINL